MLLHGLSENFRFWAAGSALIFMSCACRSSSRVSQLAGNGDYQELSSEDANFQSRLLKAAGLDVKSSTVVERLAFRSPITTPVELIIGETQEGGATKTSALVRTEIIVYVLGMSPTGVQTSTDTIRGQPHYLCRFDSHLVVDHSSIRGLSIFGRPMDGPHDIAAHTKIVTSSEPIKAGPTSAGQSLEASCGDYFKTQLANSTRELFLNFAANLATANDRPPCTAASEPGGVESDPSCRTWHMGFSETIRNRTIARCVPEETISNSIAFCQLRARFGTLCPVFISKSMTYVDQTDDGVFALATRTVDMQFYCDSLRNHECKAHRKSGGSPSEVVGVCDLP